MNRIKKSSLNRKFFWSILITSSISILTIITLSSITFYNRYLTLEETYSMQQLDYIAGQLNSYLTSVTNYSKTISVDNVVQQLTTKYNNSPMSFHALDQMSLKQQISKIIQSTPFIHSVRLYSCEGSTIVTTEFFPYENSVQPITDIKKPMWVTCKKYDRERKKEIKSLSLIRPYYSYKTAETLGYMEISIPETQISKIYTGKTDSNHNIFIMNSDGQIESSTKEDMLYSKSNVITKLRTTDENSGFYYTSSNIAFFSYFPELEWYFIHEINLMTFLQPAIATFQITILIALASVISCFFISRAVSSSVTSPLYKLIDHTRKIKNQNEWKPIETIKTNDSDITHLVSEFNTMIIAQEQLKNDLMESQKMKSKISLDLLQQQISPHFLYNTLDNICSLAEIDEKETLIDIVMNLSSFYRGTLSNGKFVITLKEELNITRSYLHIMNIRYYEKFDYTITCDPALFQFSCLKLLLQPIVENSIYHGIKELSYKGQLNIEVTEQDDDLLITVTDNGKGISTNDFSQIWNLDTDHFGIKNIHERIKLYYGNEYGLLISNAPSGGCIVTIHIKKKVVI